MRLEHAREFRLPVADDRAGKEHSAGLAAYHAGSDHVVPDLKIVLGSEIPLDHLAHFFVARHHDVAHSRAFSGDINPAAVEHFYAVKILVPGVRILFLGRTLRPAEGLVKAARYNAVENGTEMPAFGLEGMGKEHGVGVSVPDLFGAHINFPVVRINVKEQLRRVEYLIDRLHGVLSADDGEISHGVQNEQERACYAEEIAHHQVRGPCGLQLGKTVKNIERVFAFLLDDIMDVHGEILETVGERDVDRLYARSVIDQRLVARKPEIYDVPFILDCLADVGFHEEPEIRELRDAPYNIVAEPDVVERRVHFGYAALYPVKCCHIDPSSFIPSDRSGIWTDARKGGSAGP